MTNDFRLNHSLQTAKEKNYLVNRLSHVLKFQINLKIKVFSSRNNSALHEPSDVGYLRNFQLFILDEIKFLKITYLIIK